MTETGAVPGNAGLLFVRSAADPLLVARAVMARCWPKAMVWRPYGPSHRIRDLPRAYSRIMSGSLRQL